MKQGGDKSRLALIELFLFFFCSEQGERREATLMKTSEVILDIAILSRFPDKKIGFVVGQRINKHLNVAFF